MTLANLVEKYIAYRRAQGIRYGTQAYTLRTFARRLGSVNIAHVQPEDVHAFLYSSKSITTAWHQKHSTLNVFYRYAILRGWVKASPLPMVLPKKAQYALPYIYSEDEIKALLDSSKILSNEHRPGQFPVIAFRTLLLLLYGAGLRLSEALSLKMENTDLSENLLIVRNTKFYKTRLVPIGSKLATVLRNYVDIRKKRYCRPEFDSILFLNSRGKALSRQNAERDFKLIREHAGIHRTDGAFFPPRLHDLRASFAVHRLMAWYKEGANVQKLLPQLSTYLGHVNISDTQVYLRMTPELLREANLRFENYALSEVDHDG